MKKVIQTRGAKIRPTWHFVLRSALVLLFGSLLLQVVFNGTLQLYNLIAPAVAVFALLYAAFYGILGLSLSLPVLLATFFAALSVSNGATAGLLIPANITLLYSFAGSILAALLKNRSKTERKNLEWLSIMDGLTEIYNHRYFQQRLNEELARAKRDKSELALAFVDVDNFKKYNDERGHVIGDMALKKTAAFLNRDTRLHDVVCRYGGDEFVIILPGTNSEEAANVAARLVDRFSRLKLPTGPESSSHPLTLSIGISAYPGQEDCRQGLIKQADQALYLAKKAGKNRVVCYKPAVEENRGKNGENCSREKTAGGFSGESRALMNMLLLAQERTLTPLNKAMIAVNSDSKGNGNGNGNGKKEALKSCPSVVGRAIGLGHLNLDREQLQTYLKEMSLN